MAQQVPEGLHRQLMPIQFTDSEIRRVMANASREADKIMKTLGSQGTASSAIRSAQIAMAKVNAEMWGSVKDATTVGIGDAVWNATEMQALFDEKLFRAAGVTSTYWRASMIEQSKSGLATLIARKENGFTLSDKVYKNEALSKGYLDDAINNGIALGKSAAEIAKDVIGFIDPATPGGASYAAMRLGRTELQNAFHQTARKDAIETPWIESVRWQLSGSHPKPDKCNEYAESVNYKGGQPGYWKPEDIPDKPHPNCLCYTTPENIDDDAFVKAFKQGKYDSYLEKQMGCARFG